jgi:aminopeptidase N
VSGAVAARVPRLLSRSGVAAALALLVAASPVAAASPGATGAGDPYFPLQGNGGYDVTHYGLNLRWDPARDQLDGVATISAAATQSLSAFDLDLRRDLVVSSVAVNGDPADFSQPVALAQELVVRPRHALPRGRSFTVVVVYAGVPPVITDPDGSIEGWIPTANGAFVVGEPQGSPGWYPCNDTPTDKASFDVSITVPAGYTAVSNGEMSARPSTRHGWTTFAWRERQPMATYLATASVSHFVVTTGRTPGGVPWTTAVEPGLVADSAPALAKLPAMVDYFTSVFGPYPFGSAGAIVMDAPDVGYALETQTKPIFPYAPDDLTLAHELAHQWFGDSVTLRHWSDIWLNEGFAEWSSWMWSEKSGGDTAQAIFDYYYSFDNTNDWLWRPVPADPGGPATIFASSVYERGAMTLQALRVKVGDETFFRILRGWATRHRYGTASVDEFTAYASRVSHQDLTHFFDVWLYQPDKPSSW